MTSNPNNIEQVYICSNLVSCDGLLISFQLKELFRWKKCSARLIGKGSLLTVLALECLLTDL